MSVSTKDFPQGVNEIVREDGTIARRRYGKVAAGTPRVKTKAVCQFLGAPRDGDVLVAELVCGCKANRTRTRKSFIVHDCAKFGRAIPSYTCQKDALEIVVSGEWDGAQACKFCELNPMNAGKNDILHKA